MLSFLVTSEILVHKLHELKDSHVLIPQANLCALEDCKNRIYFDDKTQQLNYGTGS